MQKLALVVLMAVVAVLVGCSGKKIGKKNPGLKAVEPKAEWVEEPFAKVKLAEDLFDAYAEVWLDCESGDIVKADYKRLNNGYPYEVICVYKVRKDATRVGLPRYVHQPETKDVYHIKRYHLTVKGRIVNFFDP